MAWAMKWQEIDGGCIPCSGTCIGVIDKAL
jgi:hypothetical protein